MAKISSAPTDHGITGKLAEGTTGLSPFLPSRSSWGGTNETADTWEGKSDVYFKRFSSAVVLLHVWKCLQVKSQSESKKRVFKREKGFFSLKWKVWPIFVWLLLTFGVKCLSFSFFFTHISTVKKNLAKFTLPYKRYKCMKIDLENIRLF